MTFCVDKSHRVYHDEISSREQNFGVFRGQLAETILRSCEKENYGTHGDLSGCSSTPSKELSPRQCQRMLRGFHGKPIVNIIATNSTIRYTSAAFNSDKFNSGDLYSSKIVMVPVTNRDGTLSYISAHTYIMCKQ